MLALVFNNMGSIIINVILLVLLGAGIYSGYKKGFLESSVRFLGTVVAFIGAYLFKNPISVFLYTHLPFFNFSGAFKGIAILNVIVYELVAFLLLFTLIMIVIKVVCKITGLVDRLLSLILLFGLPNKILGAVVGFIESIIILYFLSFGVKFACNFNNINLPESLMDDIVNIPVLNTTFGDTLSSLDEITSLAKEYEDQQDKDEFNKQAIDVLLKYEIISKENLQILIDSGKIADTLEEENVKETNE